MKKTVGLVTVGSLAILALVPMFLGHLAESPPPLTVDRGAAPIHTRRHNLSIQVDDYSNADGGLGTPSEDTSTLLSSSTLSPLQITGSSLSSFQEVLSQPPSPSGVPTQETDLLQGGRYVDRYNVKARTKNGTTYRGECVWFTKRSPLPRLLPKGALTRNGCEKRLPEAFIVGTKKCGTMTLVHYLALHPAITIRGEAALNLLMRPGRARSDVLRFKYRMPYSSPRQLPMAESPGLICKTREQLYSFKAAVGNEAKFIDIVRDPVVRAVSDYLQKLNVYARIHEKEVTDLSFPFNYRGDTIFESFTETAFLDSAESKINASQALIKFGAYVNCVRSFLTVFRRDQLLVLDGNVFIENPFKTVREVEEFLQLPGFFRPEHFRRNEGTGFFCPSVPERPDQGCSDSERKGRPHPKVDNTTLATLYDFYRPYNHEMAEELQLDFPWMLV